MTSLQEFSLPVHKSFHQPDLLLGLPKSILILILLSAVGMMYIFGAVYGLIGIILYVPCSVISRHDPHLLEYALDSLFQIDHLEG